MATGDLHSRNRRGITEQKKAEELLREQADIISRAHVAIARDFHTD
jgi:hypothetical protein